MIIKKIALFLLILTTSFSLCQAQSIDEVLPIRGFTIKAPTHEKLEQFIDFIKNDLIPSHINTIILRVDWNYASISHPEFADGKDLPKEDITKLVRFCKKNNIRIIPLLNLLGHQSLGKQKLALLREYPQFEEVPSEVDRRLRWPQPDGFYCKSYCPLHPDVHKVVFDVIDEICDAFQTDTFHAGMDEVFYIGEKDCPRCCGKDRSELFAHEVTTIHDHLASKGRKLMIWGDRLLDGRMTGLGMWEASYIDTWRAIDMIPKDVVICDWHYERADLSAVYFAMKGFSVITFGYKIPEVSIQQIKDMIRFRTQTISPTASHLLGYVHSIWDGADSFLEHYYLDEGVDITKADQLYNGMAAFRTVLGFLRDTKWNSEITSQAN